MTFAPRLAAALGAVLLGALTASATAQSAPAACEGMTPPRRLTTAFVTLPASYTATRLGGIVIDEAVIGIDGRVSGVRVVRARVEGLAPFGQKSIEESLFDAALMEGNPVATRVQIATTLGTVVQSPHRARVRHPVGARLRRPVARGAVAARRERREPERHGAPGHASG